jgi:NAD(P)-dependent dehydrogenase (short-subunit alcohol dehydrogenase family)
VSLPVAVITGAAHGIGLESARRLAPTHRVAMLDLDGETAEREAAAIGRDALAVRCDITDPASVEAAIDQIVAECGGIDVCISNAGIATAGALRMLDPEVLQAQLNVNLTGNWRFIHACLPHVIARRGYVLGVASLAAIAPTPGLGSYSSSKAGFEQLLNCLRIELAPLGVDVGVAYFGFIDTDMVRGTDRHHPGMAQLREEAGGPLGRAIPVAAAGRAIARGVETRAKRIVAPRWVAALFRGRGLIQGFLLRQGKKFAPEVDRITEEMVRDRGAFGAGLRPGEAASAAAAESVARGD